MRVYIRPEWVYFGHKNPIIAEEKTTVGEHAYLVAIRCGGLMEDPDFHDEDFQIIRANSPEEAEKTYDIINKSRFYHGQVIGCVDEPYEPTRPEDINLEYASVTRRPMMHSCDIVLRERPLDRGLTKDNIDDMLSILNCHEMNLDEAFPIEFQGEHSAAMGFISTKASEQMNYDHKGLEQFIVSILNDMEKESAICRYEYEGFKIWLSR